jgi:hypothetical protein
LGNGLRKDWLDLYKQNFETITSRVSRRLQYDKSGKEDVISGDRGLNKRRGRTLQHLGKEFCIYFYLEKVMDTLLGNGLEKIVYLTMFIFMIY